MSAPTSRALSDVLAPLRDDPARAGIFCDVDGTLAPIVSRAEDAEVREEASLLLGRLAGRYGCVACVSGRSATEARRLVGVGEIAYAGSHGAEILAPGATTPRVIPAFKSWEQRVRGFVARRDPAGLRRLRIRIEHKGPIEGLHWRGAPDEGAARTHLEGIAHQAEAEGLAIHWGRKVLEVRPPIPIDKGQAVRELAVAAGLSAALYGGDDATDLDAFATLDALLAGGELHAAVKVGVRSDEGPPAITESADLTVDGVDGYVAVLAALAAD